MCFTRIQCSFAHSHIRHVGNTETECRVERIMSAQAPFALTSSTRVLYEERVTTCAETHTRALTLHTQYGSHTNKKREELDNLTSCRRRQAFEKFGVLGLLKTFTDYKCKSSVTAAPSTLTRIGSIPVLVTVERANSTILWKL